MHLPHPLLTRPGRLLAAAARLAIAALLAAAPARPDTGYIWPVPLAPALSSTFGETRATAFHAGIDVKTWGKTGYEARAIADGHVARVRTSPWGYGRALYLRLADGRMAVYGHLESFAPEIEARVRRAQEKAHTYSVDLAFEAGELPVKQGQVVARTGQTGAGPPHLHLELRAADNAPINPLTNGYGSAIQDTEAPVLRAVALTPLDRDSAVDGQLEQRLVSLRWNAAAGRFESGETVAVQGRIGVSALVHDQADGVTNKLGPYRLALAVDGQPVFSSRYGRLSYDDMHQVALDRLRLGAKGNDAYTNLFRLPGNRLPFYELPAGGDGALQCGAETGEGPHLARGLHDLEIAAADAAGNQSRARLRVQVDAAPRLAGARVVRGTAGLFLEAEVYDPDDALLEVEVAAQAGTGQWQVLETGRVASGSGPYTWRLPGDQGTWRLRVKDEAGLAAERILGLAPGPPAPPLELVLEPEARTDCALLRIRSSQTLAADPAVRIRVEGTQTPGGILDRLLTPARTPGAAPVRLRQVGPREYEALIPLAGGEEGSDRGAAMQVDVGAAAAAGAACSAGVRLSLQRVAPGRAAVLELAEGAALLTFAAQSAYAPLYPQATAFAPAAGGELEATTAGVDLGPARVAFDRPVTVALRAAGRPLRQLGVYASDGKGGWAFLGNQLTADSARVTATVRKLGRFAVLADRTPPQIRDLEPADNGRAASRRPRLRAGIADAGSGIGREQDIELSLDGRRLISVYDPEAATVEYRPEQDLAPGRHELVVRVRDLCGNEAARTARFEVR
ncbi:MAG: M23 family metallopeptidase [Gemmatimonadota bacterium]